MDSYRKSPAPAKTVAPKLSDLSFVKSLRERGKRGGGYNWWSVAPSGDYGADCLTGRKLAFEYLKYLQHATLPLQWIVDDMRKQELNGVEVGFLGTVSKAASLGSCVAGDKLQELIFNV